MLLNNIFIQDNHYHGIYILPIDGLGLFYGA